MFIGDELKISFLPEWKKATLCNVAQPSQFTDLRRPIRDAAGRQTEGGASGEWSRFRRAQIQ